MSVAVRILENPSWTVSRLIFTGVSGYGLVKTFILGFSAWMLTLADKEHGIMIFEGIDNIILVLGLVIGAVVIPTVSFWFKYQDVQKHKEEVKKFSLEYYIALGLTIVIGVFFAYIVTIFGLQYVATDMVVTEVSLAFVIAFIVGGICSYLADTVLFHPLADGTVARAWVKEQERIRKEIASQEAQELFLATVKDRCKALGLEDEGKIAMIIDMVKGDEDLDKIPAFVKLLMTPAPAEEVIA